MIPRSKPIQPTPKEHTHQERNLSCQTKEGITMYRLMFPPFLLQKNPSLEDCIQEYNDMNDKYKNITQKIKALKKSFAHGSIPREE